MATVGGSVSLKELKERKTSRVGGAHLETVHVISQRAMPHVGKTSRVPDGAEAGSM